MVIILRRVGPAHWTKLRKCGLCKVSFCELVGTFQSREFKVIFLGE